MKFSSKKFIFYFIISLFLFNFESLLGKCFYTDCLENDLPKNKSLTKKSIKSIKRYRKNSNYFALLKSLEKDNISLNMIFASLIKDVDQNKSEVINMEVNILSEIQYEIDNTFYAEKNVDIIFSNGILKADQISYDKKNKIFKANGNIVFKQGQQYFEADKIEYDFKLKKGYINNIYGALNFLTLKNDINYENLVLKKDIDNNKNSDIINPSAEVQLLNSNNLRFRNKLGFETLKFDFNSISKWRFKSNKIFLGLNNFNSELVYFTNDPYNKPQLILKSVDLKGEVINGKSKLNSKKTTLIVDDFLTIPLGSRTIQDTDSTSSWGFGYDDKNADGVYYYRTPFSFDNEDNISLEITPYFLIQRAIFGKTNSFRDKDSNLYSQKTRLDTKFLDYFATNGVLRAKLNGLDFNLNTYLKSLNLERLYDSATLDATLVKNLYLKEILNINKGIIENKDKKFNLKLKSDFGLYSIFQKDDIHSAFGSKFINFYSYKSKDFYKRYDLIIDLGQFGAKSASNNNHLNLFRYGLITSINHRYKILNLNPLDYSFDIRNKYSSELVDQGLFLDLKISSGYYKYSNGDEQSNIILSTGPKLQIGNLRERFFDYTSLFLSSEFTFKNNESPFSFDNLNEDSRIKLDFKQQFYGPILIGFKSNLNINSNSNNYGKFENTWYSFGISRRAYSIDFSYNENDRAFLFDFKIFDFGFKDISSKF